MRLTRHNHCVGVGALEAADADRHSDGPPGTVDGQFPLWAVVLHVNHEVIRHGAEVALLRDLFRTGGFTAPAT